MTNQPVSVTILLDIKEDIGKLSGEMTSVTYELREARTQRAELAEGQAKTRQILTPLIADAAAMEKRVEKLEAFEGKVSQYIWAGGIFVSGVLFFLWKGLEFFASDIRAWLGKLFH